MIRRIAAAAAAAGVIALGVAVPSASASAQALSCRTSTGSTGGWAECTGSGTWRVVSDCWGENDKFTTWITTRVKTRQYAVDCQFDIERVYVETR